MSTPTIEQLATEIRHWRTSTRMGRTAEAAKATEVIARNMVAHIPEVDQRSIGVVLLRLASLLANEPDMPLPLALNLIAAAGADLISRDVAQEMREQGLL